MSADADRKRQKYRESHRAGLCRRCHACPPETRFAATCRACRDDLNRRQNERRAAKRLALAAAEEIAG